MGCKLQLYCKLWSWIVKRGSYNKTLNVYLQYFCCYNTLGDAITIDAANDKKCTCNFQNKHQCLLIWRNSLKGKDFWMMRQGNVQQEDILSIKNGGYKEFNYIGTSPVRIRMIISKQVKHLMWLEKQSGYSKNMKPFRQTCRK